jgi:hypothetical protein
MATDAIGDFAMPGRSAIAGATTAATPHGIANR